MGNIYFLPNFIRDLQIQHLLLLYFHAPEAQQSAWGKEDWVEKMNWKFYLAMKALGFRMVGLSEDSNRRCIGKFLVPCQVHATTGHLCTHFLFYKGVCICVCMHLYTYMLPYRDQRRMSGVLLYHFLPCFLVYGLSLNLDPTELVASKLQNLSCFCPL